MHFMDRKFSRKKLHFFLQPLMAIVLVFLILFMLGGVRETGLLGIIGSTSIGASAFLVLSAPRAKMASPRHMVGGYIVSIIVGVCFWLIVSCSTDLRVNNYYYLCELAAASAMGVAMFFMVLFDFEHPPAAGLALGLVIEHWDWYTLFVLVIAVVVLEAVRLLIRRWLINLV